MAKDIRIPFTVGGRNFEAVGFLHEDDGTISGGEILARTATKNGGAIGDEDEEFLRQHRDELPSNLKPYWLVTRSDPDFSRIVSYLSYGLWHWNYYQKGWLDFQRADDYLVVLRCP